MADDPLPLIIPPESVHLENERYFPEWAGYALLALTWLLFVVTVNSLFECWKWIIEPLSWSEDTKQYYEGLTGIFTTIDNLVLSLWCIYVVMWWWALFSWIGLKLFKQSKGIQT